MLTVCLREIFPVSSFGAKLIGIFGATVETAKIVAYDTVRKWLFFFDFLKFPQHLRDIEYYIIGCFTISNLILAYYATSILTLIIK